MRKIAVLLLGVVALAGCVHTADAPPKDPADAPGAEWREELACQISLTTTWGC